MTNKLLLLFIKSIHRLNAINRQVENGSIKSFVGIAVAVRSWYVDVFVLHVSSLCVCVYVFSLRFIGLYGISHISNVYGVCALVDLFGQQIGIDAVAG